MVPCPVSWDEMRWDGRAGFGLEGGGMAMVGEVNCDGSIVSGLGDMVCALEERGGGQDENIHGSFKPPSQVPLAVVVGQGIRKLRGLGLHPLTAQPVKGGRMGEAVTAALSPLWDRPSSQYFACPIQRGMIPPNAACWVVIFSARHRLSKRWPSSRHHHVILSRPLL